MNGAEPREHESDQREENSAMRGGPQGHLRPDQQQEEPIEGGTPTFALRDVPLAGHFITFSLCLSVARIDTPPLQPAASAFVSYGFALVRVRVQNEKNAREVTIPCPGDNTIAGTGTSGFHVQRFPSKR